MATISRYVITEIRLDPAVDLVPLGATYDPLPIPRPKNYQCGPERCVIE